jgi:hypothetical protein
MKLCIDTIEMIQYNTMHRTRRPSIAGYPSVHYSIIVKTLRLLFFFFDNVPHSSNELGM